MSTFASVGTAVVGCGGGGGSDAAPAPPPPATSVVTPQPAPEETAPAVPETPVEPEVPDPVFSEPTSVSEYLASMGLGIQASDYLETPREGAGAANAVVLRDFDTMHYEGGFGHVRIPANCAARADVNGVISETFLLELDAQIAWALRRLERVILDPLHHYLQWKGNHDYDVHFQDSAAVALLTAEEHARRATAMWVQLATRYRDVSLRLSFDLFNEPGGITTANFPPGLTAVQLNDWHAAVIPAIRACGGKNADRLIWLEPWSNQVYKLVLPTDAGAIGLSTHCYDPNSFTHRASDLTAAGMSNYVESVRWAKNWAADHGVPLWLGEAGVTINKNNREPHVPAQRAEYIAHLRATAIAEGVPTCIWGYNSNFGIYDQANRAWLPDMQQAVSAIPTSYPVRELPSFIHLKGGRIPRSYYITAYWPGFTYDPETGVLTGEANTATINRVLVIVFPDIPVESGQSWIARAVEYSGDWTVGNSAFYFDPDMRNINGEPGLDARAVNQIGQVTYPSYLAPAPGGYENPYGTLVSPSPYFAITVNLLPGSPAGSISFTCIRSV